MTDIIYDVIYHVMLGNDVIVADELINNATVSGNFYNYIASRGPLLWRTSV